MALSHLVRALLRRWPILVIGALCTASVGLVAVRADGVYWSRTNVVFLAPSSTLYPNALKTRSEDLIITAGLVAKRINGPAAVEKFSSVDATMIGVPRTDSPFWLRLPDTGGQWSPNFADQFLILEVVGDSPEEVRAIQDEVVERARFELNAMQREQLVDPVNDITLTVAPDPAIVFHVTGNRIRALGMIGALGMGVTLAVVIALEYRSRRDLLLEPDAIHVH